MALSKNELGTIDTSAITVVDTSEEGVNIKEFFESIDGTDPTEVEFSDVTIPIANLITESPQGRPNATIHILRERLCQAAISIDMVIFAVRITEEHLDKEDSTGRRKSVLEGIRLRHSDMRVKAYVARSVLYRIARLYEKDQEIMNEVNMAKVFCTEAASEIIDCAIQLTGGSALIQGHPLNLLYRKVRAMRISGGSSDVLRLNISRGVFEFKAGSI